MSWVSRLLFGPASGAPLVLANGAPVVRSALIMPGQDQSSLVHIAYSEVYGGDSDVVDRAAAMSVPPIKRGRAVIVGSIADLPLVAGTFDGPGNDFVPAPDQPAWLTTTRTVVTPWHRIASTLDDLIFEGWSLWEVARAEDGSILDAARVAPSRWRFDPDTPLGVRLDNEPLTDPRSVILFQGPDDGILRSGADIIRGARAIEKAWVGRVRNPIPAMVLHEVNENGVTQDEAKQYVAAWSAARTSDNGAIGFLPASLQMEVYGDTTQELFTEGRNNVRLDVANLLNLPASILEGSTATASLTYVTREGERASLIDWLEYWLAPLEARLSMDDVTPEGAVVRFSRGNMTNVPNDPYGAELVTEPAATPEEAAA